ncbi:MAG: LysR family transcriptional regulator [Pseudomonadota bacterium]|nr:LysR family transcriptional regulator [Pseudomonadota bacterium]
MDWNDIRYFLALARLGSVRAAGKTLEVSHSTVARRVEALEARLGTRLFDRSQDGYVLTAAGRQMVPGAERVELEMADLERAVVGQDGRLAGTVAITCGDNFVAGLLLDALAAFCAEHPDVELRFTVDGRPFDLLRREADVAVRVLSTGASPPEYLLGTKVGPVILASYVAVAHAAHLDPARPGTPARWLAFEDRKTVERLIEGSSWPSLPAWGSFDSLEAILSAARAGLGLVLLPVYVGDPDPTLARLGTPDLRHLGDLWLLCHPDLRHTARVQAVRAVVARVFRERAALFRGEAWSDSAHGCPDFAPPPALGPGIPLQPDFRGAE